MDQGLDELIEWLLTKIAYSGLEGLSARDFVIAVKLFYSQRDVTSAAPRSSAPIPDEKQEVDVTDVSNASIVWKWIVRRKDVIVVPESLELLPLEEVLLPATSSAHESKRTSTKAAEDSSAASRGRAHLLLSEERQWKAIAGHGPDLKRIPLFEWRALVAIASIGEGGILQGDLVRLTGQDKRSLPTRTDALARKGYIIKQQAMLRGCRTSKLWLAQFANNAKADVVRYGLPEDALNTPREEIIKSWDPVSFKHHYLDDGPLDYVAISQTFLIIVKAYGAMRYCDIRHKMDINERVSQMRGLAKSSRWWARAGVVRFEPMKSNKKGKLFKDCVKFIRDPTKEEWAKYRSTPKANLKIPSTRLRNRKKSAPSKAASTAAAPTQPRRLGQKPLPKLSAPRILPSPSLIRLSSWNPYKPITSTFVEIIKRNGIQGSSNTELGMFNLGWPYRKYISTLTTMISLPRTLPPHLQPFAVHSTFTRLGKTMTYKFHSVDAVKRGTAQDLSTSGTPKSTETYEATFLKDMGTMPDGHCFPHPTPGQFLKPGSRVKGYLPFAGLRAVCRAAPKRIREFDDDTPASVKRPKLAPSTASETIPTEASQSEPLQPGVYFGEKNSLDPTKGKGRPKKSIVMKFVSPQLKNPDFISRRLPRSNGSAVAGVSRSETPGDSNDKARPPEIDEEVVSAEPSISRRPPKRGRSKGSKQFECDKCGSSYKNINGLEYHQTKSQSACNPDWVPPSPKPALRLSTPTPTSKRQSKSFVELSEEPMTVLPQNSPATSKQTLPSRRPKRLVTETRVPAQGFGNRQHRIIAHPVKLQNVLELPTAPSSRSTSVGLTLTERSPEKRTKALINTPNPGRPSNKKTSTSRQATSHAHTTSSAVHKTQELELSTALDGDTDKNKSPHPPHPPVLAGDAFIPMDVGASTTSLASSPVTSQIDQDGGKSNVANHASSKTSHKTSDPQQRSKSPVRKTQKLYGRQKATALRREHMTNLILRLLEQNEQVLPGDVSLYCLVTSKWSEDVTDTSVVAPEWKMFQRMLRDMEKERLVSIHYFAMMSRGNMKQISVIYKGYYENGATMVPESIDRKINEVKNKYQELYPNPYIPSQFSLSGNEADICRDLAKKYRNIDAPESDINVVSSSGAKEIPTLGYDMPVNSDITGTKTDQHEADNSDEPHDSTRRKKRKLRNKRDEMYHAETQGPNSMTTHDTRWDIEVAPPGMTQALEASSSIHFITPTTVAMYEKGTALADDPSEEEEDDDDDDASVVDVGVDLETQKTANHKFNFAPVETITAFEDGVWPGQFPRAFFMNRPGGSFRMAGSFPEPNWFLRQNLPQTMREMVDSTLFRRGSTRRDVSRYGQFGSDVEAIEAWERSPEGAYLQNLGNIAPEHIFISLSSPTSPANMDPLKAEWSPESQYTIDDLPESIRYAVSEDDSSSQSKAGSKKRTRGNGARRRPFVKRSAGHWKHRTLSPVYKREIGRWNKERAVGVNIGREKETELIVAIVILRKLLGGVDKITDWGVFLRLYPEWSISGVRKFWIRVTKERASYIEALSNKFHVAFLEAYEKGELLALNYDDLENYDWKTLIDWALKLETHHGVELPTTREQFDREYLLVSPKKDEEDWRELWFHFQTSTYDRLDAASSLAMVLPIAGTSTPDSITNADLQLARSWVRALCNNNTQATVGPEIRGKLLQLGSRDKASLNELLERAVTQLLESKVISKIFGKGFGQVFKLNNYYELRLKKFTHIEKYTQALAFKAELDESFRNNKEVSIPINTNDGSIMVMINLQAHGRIRLDDFNFPHVPFGFEPGNYEGRKYPKRYYMFDVKIVPTDRYIYNEDLPVVAHAEHVPIPTKGPIGEIPIWCDFFGHVDRTRWVHYVCMVTFALSVKGPMAVAASNELLYPVVEAFEAELIMNWLDRMGLVEKVTPAHGATVGEWWWLVVGKQINVEDKVAAEK